MALSDLYSNGGQGAASPSPVPTPGPVKRPKGPSPLRLLAAWFGGHLHLITLVLGVVTGLGFFAARVTSDVPTDAAIFKAITDWSYARPGSNPRGLALADPEEGVSDIRIGSCRRQIVGDLTGESPQQWACGLSYESSGQTRSRTLAVLGLHDATGRTATLCADCGPPLHFIDRGAPDRLEGGQFVHLPSTGAQP